MEQVTEPVSVETAIVALQASSTPSGDRLNALRYLRNYVTAERTGGVDKHMVSKINRLVLDNVLAMTLSEENNVDHRRRQHIRAECLLMLSQILETPSLFDDARRRVDELSSISESTSTGGFTNSVIKHKSNIQKGRKQVEHTATVSLSLSQEVDLKHVIAINTKEDKNLRVGIIKPSEDWKIDISDAEYVARSLLRESLDTNSISTIDTTLSTPSLSRSNLGSSIGLSGIANTVIKDKIKPKVVRLELKQKRFRPRASVIYGSEYEQQAILPGIDKDNWILADKKLGYQKSRMWFPIANIGIDSSMLPEPRKLIIQSDNIVEEYLHMKALLSYIGDLVVPFSGIQMGGGFGNRETKSIDSQSKSKVDSSLYIKAVASAARYWNPIIGSSLPAWARPKLKFITDDATVLPSSDSPYSEVLTVPSTQPPGLQQTMQGRKVIWSKQVLRKLLRKEIASTTKIHETLCQTLSLLNKTSRSNNSNISESNIRQIQTNLSNSLKISENNIKQSSNQIQTVMKETVKLQYSNLPSRYILYLEKTEKSPKQMVYRLTELFFRVKVNNLLNLAIGIWKLLIVKSQMTTNSKKYFKIAGAQLLVLWLKYKNNKRKRIWIDRWRMTITKIIFAERIPAAIVIQTLYRMWRDRRLFLRLHRVAMYGGPLSDIYLAATRKGIKFYMPREIREGRRMIWLATTVVQARYRGLLARRWYWAKLYILILIQSLCRMWPKKVYYRKLKKWSARVRRFICRRKFLLWKFSITIVEKYIRRFLSQGLKWRLLHRKWQEQEGPMGLAIWLQTRWREKKSRKVLELIKEDAKERDRAALRLQAHWYKHKKAFHTFLLMCVYRSIDELERLQNKAGKSIGRGYSARMIERFYKRRYYHRLLSSACRIQCWYRGVKGYNYVLLMRRRQWASRKLHHWARSWMRFKHKCVRMIQRCWWSFRRKFLLLHLHRRLRSIDLAYDVNRREIRFLAASRIQAILKGILCRLFIKRDTAIRKIQKVVKFWLFRMKCKREARLTNLRFCTKFISNIIGHIVLSRTITIVKLHNKLVIKPQAVVRGILVRRCMTNARKFAQRYSKAVVCVQRFWTRNLGMLKAVQELMVIKRMDENPFREATGLHLLMKSFRQLTDTLFTTRDSRGGMRLHTLLQRTGYTQYFDIFYPKTDFQFVSQLQRTCITEDAYIALYNKHIKRQAKNKLMSTLDKNKTAEKVALLEVRLMARRLLELTIPPIGKIKSAATLTASAKLQCVTEYLTPKELTDFIVSLFCKKFGKNLAARAMNFSRICVEMAFTKYNNYKAVICPLTVSMIERVIEISQTAGDLRDNLEKITAVSSLPDDIVWSYQRVEKAADMCEFAAERLMSILPYGKIKLLIERTLVRLSQYKRKFAFVLKHMKLLAVDRKRKELKAQNDARKDIARGVKNKEIAKSNDSSKVSKDDNNVILIVGDDTPLSVASSIVLSFPPDGDVYIELELHTSRCKVLYELFDKLDRLTNCIQSLKTHWQIKLLAKKTAKARETAFVNAIGVQYLHERKEVPVLNVWKKSMKLRDQEQKVQSLVNQRNVRIAEIEEEIACILRFGWKVLTDQDGYTYYARGGYNSTYDIPCYFYNDYMSACCIQRAIRRRQLKQKQRKDAKEASKLKDIQEAYAQYEAMLGTVQSLVKFSYTLQFRNTDDTEPASKEKISTFQESFLPYKLRFIENHQYQTGDWAILRSEDEITYEVVVVFRLRKDLGSKVEVRYKSQKLFYKGMITAVHCKDDELLYTILYDDGEIERGVRRNMIRSPAEAIDEFVAQRQAAMSQLDKRLVRLSHYRRLKSERLCKAAAEKERCCLDFVKHWSQSTGEINPHTPTSTTPPELTAEKSNKKPNVNSMKKTNVASVEAVVTSPGDSVLAMLSIADYLGALSVESTCSIVYMKRALRFNWYQTWETEKLDRRASFRQSDEVKLKKYEIYINTKTNEKTRVPPVYLPEESYATKKIQSLYLLYVAKKSFKNLLNRQSIPAVIKETLLRYQQIAWIGYRLEGLDILLLLRRAGCHELAIIIGNHFNGRPTAYQAVTIPYLINIKRENFQLIGLQIENEEHTDVIKSLIDFQRWYKKSTPAQIEASLTLLSYFKYPNDDRSILDVVRASENLIFKKLEKAMKNNVTRARTIAVHASKSKFPHGRRQIDSFVQKYGEKPGVAEERVSELVDKATTNTWVEEKEAYRVLRRGVRQLGTILGNFKMKHLRAHIASIEKQADDMMQQIDTDPLRPKLTGPEAKAALLLRIGVLAYLEECTKKAVVIQTFLRCRFRRRFIAKRHWAIGLMSRLGRGFNARKLAAYMRLQQQSPLEQLWDDNRRLLYYYNKIQRFSTYEEPEVSYRPLVRDRRTDLLIQAWPFLELTDKKMSLPPTSAPGTFVPPQKCQSCNVRKTTRVCLDCLCMIVGHEGQEQEVPTAYCFTCYIKAHNDEVHMQMHNFHDVTKETDESQRHLTCSDCKTLPATRKCLGILDDRQIDEVCTELQRKPPSAWMNVLNTANIAGERKLTMMIEKLMLEAGRVDSKELHLNGNQLQQVRTMLERTRAECDEVFCQDCYMNVHSTGRRLMHKWVGFEPFAMSCSVCSRCVAEVTCTHCQSIYCRSCFKVFHSKGRKRKHVMELILEEGPLDDQGVLIPFHYCILCSRRVATDVCINEPNGCKFIGCNSCTLCLHTPTCQAIPSKIDKPYFECVLCSERADQICVQCNDYYCSLTWMGNPGCFAKIHKKGNRASHVTKEIDESDEAKKLLAYNNNKKKEMADNKIVRGRRI